MTVKIVCLLGVLSLLSRVILLVKSNKVVWDEAHFGKFAGYYIKREFYTDVHPPLGKMMLGFAGFVGGYNGSFDFKSGHEYPMPIWPMRLFCAFFGSLIVPLCFLTCKSFRMGNLCSITASLLILFENSLVVISKFVLLDSILLFFTALCLFFVARVDDSKRYTKDWFLNLLFLGLSLGCVASVKWVGLFFVLAVGIFTIFDLYQNLEHESRNQNIKHWLSCIFCLILIPLIVYCFWFKIHFMILTNSGPGDSQMPSLFQAKLNGNVLNNAPLDVQYGSKVTLRNNGYGGGILHSHVQRYPYGSKQQQVTCYHHRDSNNEWIISGHRLGDGDLNQTEGLVQNGSIIRLLHVSTGRNLHSHEISAFNIKREFEVSCYGNETIGDVNDNWVIESKKQIQTLITSFYIRHERLGCYLKSTPIPLPEWGFKQHLVSCGKKSKNTIWNIEQHWNPSLPPAPQSLYKSSFWEDLFQVNVNMWASNNALTPDPDKENHLISYASEWPFMHSVLRMCSWGDSDIKYLMFGNPFVWIPTSFLMVFVMPILILIMIIQQKRQIRFNLGQRQLKLYVCYLFHYIPFFLLGRVLYLHHYFPALYFQIICSLSLIQKIPRKLRSLVCLLFSLMALYGFYLFFPATYGYDYPSSVYSEGRKWRSTWTL